MRPPKYRNKKTVIDGIAFDSIKESRRYGELKLMLKAGLISNLQIHPGFVLQPAFPDKRIGLTKRGKPRTVRAIEFTADFRYTEDGRDIVEDTKSPASKTTAYEIRKRLFLRKFPDVEFREV